MSEGSIPPPTPSVPPPAPGSPDPLGSASGSNPLTSLTDNDGLGFVMDVPVELCVEIGRRVMKLGEILKLGPGSILELDKVNGEPLELYANKKLVARGQAVVVGERYGVRLTEVLVVDDDRSGE